MKKSKREIAEAPGKHLASDMFESYLAGTGKSDDDFKIVIRQIEQKIMGLKKMLNEVMKDTRVGNVG